MPKCLVNVLELNGETHWKKYKLSEDGKVQIRPVQGQYNETPSYDIEALHKTDGVLFPIPYVGPFRIWKKPYLIYPRLTNKFLKRTDKDLACIDLEYVKRVGKAQILQAYDPKEGKPDLFVIGTFLIVAALFFFLVVMPNVR